MPRILFVGSSSPLLHVLANIFAARGSLVCVSTDADQERDALLEFAPQLVLWDSEPGDASLDPSAFGYEGPTFILAQRPNAIRDHQPLRKVLYKPISTDDLVEAVLESAW
ncbi:MAG TPA: hypothetical protein VI876_09660 [Dehalococcoidia bacterium]|nr:hypothetical protein [Dehalococcoidia bacterium]